MKIPEKFKALDRYQKGVMLAMAAMIVVFAALYAYTVGRVGYEYRDAILVPSEENGATVYSGRVHGRRAEFTVSADGMVEFRCGDTLYGPYTAREDPSAVPEEHELKEGICAAWSCAAGTKSSSAAACSTGGIPYFFTTRTGQRPPQASW